MSFGSLVFTPLVKKLQERYGSRRQYERMANATASQDKLTDFEVEFLEQRDSFYWATVGVTGWPYVQHRGGPKGFVKVIDDRTLAFADLRGNKQYISTGNLQSDSRVAMILVDYPRQARLKILGRVEMLEAEPAAEWLPRVRMPEEKTPIERVFVIHVEAYDWNCPQHITPRYTAEEIREGMRSIEQRVEQLDAENRALRAEVAALKGKVHGMSPRPPLPPFTEETAKVKVRSAEDGWNSRDPEKVSLAYTVDSAMAKSRRVSAGPRGDRRRFLTRKWDRGAGLPADQGVVGASPGNRIAVRFAYEYRDDSGNWLRAYGNEGLGSSMARGLMLARHASINDLPIKESAGASSIGPRGEGRMGTRASVSWACRVCPSPGLQREPIFVFRARLRRRCEHSSCQQRYKNTGL